MPDFTTKLKKKMRSVPPVSLYFWTRFCRQSTSGSCLILLQNFKKKWAAFRLYLYVFWNRFCRQSTSAYQISYIFLVSFGTKNTTTNTCFTRLNRNSCRNSCRNSTAHWTLAKKKSAVPRCAGPQRHGGGFGPQVL